MNPALARTALLLCCLLALVAGLAGFRVPLAPVRLSAPAQTRLLESIPSPPGESLDSLSRRVMAQAPFRARRRPAPTPFDPTPRTAGTDAAQTAVKPVLTLSGVVWGVETAAVVQGFPGIEGSKVVRKGDVVGGIRVIRIERDRVSLAGLDTTWTLQIKGSWK